MESPKKPEAKNISNTEKILAVGVASNIVGRGSSSGKPVDDETAIAKTTNPAAKKPQGELDKANEDTFNLNKEFTDDVWTKENRNPESPVTSIGGVKVSNRNKEGFTFPDFRQSSPGQELRADLNFSGSGNADIEMNFKDSSGKVHPFPQTNEKLDSDEFSYGTEIIIPENTPSGVGEVWVTVNGKEVEGTRVKHNVVDKKGRPIKRYGEVKI